MTSIVGDEECPRCRAREWHLFNQDWNEAEGNYGKWSVHEYREEVIHLEERRRKLESDTNLNMHVIVTFEVVAKSSDPQLLAEDCEVEVSYNANCRRCQLRLEFGYTFQPSVLDIEV